MEKYKRHQIFWKIIRFIAPSVLKPLYKYSYELAPKLEPPYLVFSNHNGDLDPALVALSFPQQMYFVASEHVYRAGFASKILRFVFEPIAKRKGTADAVTVMKSIRALREGKNVCIFPEGQKSFNGITGEINIATGKLVKASKASLVTYKLEGGYFTTPRWGKGIRKGKMHGSIVNIYNKEDLEKLSPEEITDLVKKDLYEDAYQKQSQTPIAYKGKNLAEGIEHALCICPECKQIDTLFSKKNSVFCKNCDFTTSIDIYGYFDENCKFKTVLQWDEFQQEELKKLIQEKSSEKSEFIFSDDEVTLKTVKAEHQEEIIGTGKFSMFTDKFIFNSVKDEKEISLEIPQKNIVDISMYGKQALVFSDNNGNYYELTSKNIINVRKFIFCFKYLK
ncbi:MAG: 1-acyl-sn-glycerol-3-phosphate acyltransferase [Spirochaetaceae bacterium]|nr:1-acyl-sn-glycerol-3-phosphate acyltransferase [Spirochaetaceae bacterium]